MTKYLIQRTFSVDEEEMPEVNRRSRRLARDQFPGIVWEHSHVVVTDDGVVKTFCIYEAPSEDIVRRHAAALGKHTIDAVHEIAGDVTPDDFPI